MRDIMTRSITPASEDEARRGRWGSLLYSFVVDSISLASPPHHDFSSCIPGRHVGSPSTLHPPSRSSLRSSPHPVPPLRMDPTQAPLVGPVAPPPPVPPDVQAMERLLHSCGVHRYEPAVVQQLLEIAQHYSRSIVQEAADVKAYTGGSKVRNMHVQLGIASVRSLAFRTNIPSTAVGPVATGGRAALRERGCAACQDGSLRATVSPIVTSLPPLPFTP